jgi:LCP family protein required for cell wall assembly
MSQAPTPFEPTVEATVRRRQNRRRARPRPDQAAATAEIPEFLARRQTAAVVRPRRQIPLRSFGLGIALGFVLGHQHGLSLPLGSPLGALGQLQRQYSSLLYPLGLGRHRVLVLGSDVVSGSTDVMAAVQVQDGITRITQVPRDTYVETADHGVLKANALYGVMGPVEVKREVSGLMGVPIERHLKVNLAAVTKVADALGGVDVDVPKRMVYQDHAQGLYIDLYPGPQLLKGEALEGFLRFRHDELGDLGRMERQRLVLNQVFRKLAQPATLAQLPTLLRIAGEDIHTDLSPLELTQLMSAMAHTKLSTERLPGREYWENELSYWMPGSNAHHPSGSGDAPPN